MIPNTHNKSQQIDLIYVFWFPPTGYLNRPTTLTVIKHGSSISFLHSVSPTALGTLWAVLCLCWTGTEDYRLAAPLLPAVGWGLRLCPQDWQQGRLRNGTPGADHNSGKLRYTGMRLTGIELAI